MSWYIAVLKNYAGFSGRARRKEYWMFRLFFYLILIAVGIVGGILTAAAHSIIPFLAFIGVYYLAMFVPSIAVSCRRLHDTGRSGWWQVISYIPFVSYIGAIVILVFDCLDSELGPNKYGPNPKQLEFTPDGYGFVGYPPPGYPQAPGYPPYGQAPGGYPQAPQGYPQAPGGYPQAPQGPIEGYGPDSAQGFTER